MSFKRIVNQIIGVAEAVLPYLASSPAGPVIAVGKGVIDLIDKSKDVLREEDVARVEALREQLEAAVMAHADETADELRGKAEKPTA